MRTHVLWPLRQVAQLQQKLKVAEAAADAASKRAEQEAEFRVDVAQVQLQKLAAGQQPAVPDAHQMPVSRTSRAGRNVSRTVSWGHH